MQGAGRYCFAVKTFRVTCSSFRVWEVTGLVCRPPTWFWLQKTWILDVGVRLKDKRTKTKDCENRNLSNGVLDIPIYRDFKLFKPLKPQTFQAINLFSRTSTFDIETFAGWSTSGRATRGVRVTRCRYERFIDINNLNSNFYFWNEENNWGEI